MRGVIGVGNRFRVGEGNWTCEKYFAGVVG